MTSPNPAVRRTALAVLAVGAALGMSACGAGQISQTANQAPAVDGGHGASGDVTVNDIRVVLPEEGEGEARVGMVAAYIERTASADKAIRLQSVKVGGTEATVSASEELHRGCSLIISPTEKAPEVLPPCAAKGTVTLPSAEGLKNGQGVSVTVTFSDGATIQAEAGVVAADTVAGEYSRPAEAAAASEGH